MKIEKRKEKTIEEVQEERAEDLVVGIPEVSIKHPLEHPWCIWLNEAPSKNWNARLRKLVTFNTVEDFWCLYHYMKSPTELKNQDYAVFKESINPKWEDKANSKGGRWLITVGRPTQQLNDYWLDVVLLMIGENFKNNNAICGAVVNVRLKSKVCIWTSNSSNRSENTDIGIKIKTVLGVKKEMTYHAHNENVHSIVL